MEILGWILAALLLMTMLGLVWYFKAKALQSFKTDAPFEKLEASMVKSIADAGWKLLSMNDMQARLVNAGYDFKRIVVYEICKPDYAASVLEEDRNKRFSSLMPCRLSLYELKDGTTGISMINADLLATLFGGVVKKVMGKAASESEEIILNAIKSSEK